MTKQHISDEKIALIRKLTEMGYTPTKIARLVRVSRVTVYYRTNEGFRRKEVLRKRLYSRGRAKLAVLGNSVSVNCKPSKWTTE